MKKIRILFFIFVFFFLQSFSFEQKYVIGTMGHGFFADFFCVLMGLIGCKSNNLIPVVYWDRNCLYYVERGNQYNNAWEYYFEPVSNAHFEKSDKINRKYFFPGISKIFKIKGAENYKDNFNYGFRKTMYTIMQEYVRIKKYILEKIESFYKKHIQGKKTIGVHVRRTGKWLECPLIDVDVFLDKIREYKDYQIFIASDEYAVIEKFRKTFPGRVIYYDAHRSSNSTSHYLGRDKKDPLNAVIGEEVLIETILLSKCDIFVHSLSNVSTAVLFFNPELKHIYLDPWQYPNVNPLNIKPKRLPVL